MEAAVEVCRAAVGVVVGKEDILLFHRLAAAIQRDTLAVIGKIVGSIHSGNAGLAQHCGISCGIHQHFTAIEPPSGFAVYDNAFAMVPLHDGHGNQRIIENFHPGILQEFQQRQSEDTAGKPAVRALPGGMVRLTVFPVGIKGVKSVFYGQL